jgi:PAS domain S-box-containing protein
MSSGRLLSHLTKREEQILCLAKGGCDDLLIAKILRVSPQALDRQWAGIQTRLDVPNRAQAIATFDRLHSFGEKPGSTTSATSTPYAVIEQVPSDGGEGEPSLVYDGSFITSLLENHTLRDGFRMFVRGLADACVCTDMMGRIQECNNEFLSIIGYTNDEVRSLSFHDVTPPMWHEFEDRIINEQVLVKGFSEVYEKEYIHKNGMVFPVELRTVLFRDKSGNPMGMWAVVRDISARKGAELALSESEVKYRALFNSSVDSICLIRNDVYVDCNARTLEMFRCKREDLIGKPLYCLSPEKQPDGQLSSLKGKAIVGSLLENGRCSFEWVFKKQDGELFDAVVNLNILYLGGDKILQITFRDVTDYKSNIEKLKQSESMLRQTFDHLPVGACIVEFNGIFRHCNRAFCDLLGYDESELVGKHYCSVTMPEDYHVGEDLTAGVASGECDTCNYVKRYLRKDGQVVWGELSVTAIKDIEGIPLFFISIVIDITAKRSAEAALRESEAKLQAVFNHSLDAISVSKNGIHEFVNPAYLHLFRYDHPEELVSKTILKIIAPESKTIVGDYAKRRYRGMDAPSMYEAVGLRKDGSTFLLEVNASSYVLDNGRYTLAIMRDITERRQAQEALKKSEEKFAKAFHSNPEPASISSISDGTYIEVNEAFAKATGYSREEMIGKRSTDLGLTVDLEQRPIYLETLARDKSVRNFEATYRTKSGEIREIVIAGELIEIDNVIFNLNFYNDITERRLAERRIQEAQLELERRVAERTSQLEIANQELESFSYSVSHDLRAPLRALDGFSKILVEDYADRFDETGCLYLKRISEAAGRMGSLVDDLLKLSRINRTDLGHQKVNLSTIAQNVMKTLSEQDRKRKVKVKIAANVVVDGDAALLGSVMDNLLNNAWKYTGKQPQASIEFGVTERDGHSVYFVRDDGVGFDMAYSEHLFGAFQRLHRESEFPGNGIGLATVQRIVHRHGGRIWAESEVGKGATFYFTLGRSDELPSP